jgi:hypothetical protein
LGAAIGPKAILSSRSVGQQTFGWHRSDLKPENLSIWAHGQRDREGKVFGPFKRLELVKLENQEIRDPLSISLKVEAGLGSQKSKFPGHGGSVDSEEESTASLGHAGSEQSKQRLIHPSFMLSEARVEGGGGEGTTATETSEP